MDHAIQIIGINKMVRTNPFMNHTNELVQEYPSWSSHLNVIPLSFLRLKILINNGFLNELSVS